MCGYSGNQSPTHRAVRRFRRWLSSTAYPSTQVGRSYMLVVLDSMIRHEQRKNRRKR